MKNLMLIGKTMRKNHSLPFCLLLSVLFSFFNAQTFAQGDLMIYPKRIMFEGSNRSQELNLANSGKDSARYVLSVIQIRMKEDGAFEQITQPDPGQNFADKYFRIFPRTVVLAPNEAQTVKVQLINTTDIQPGEYRSHLYIRAEEEKKPLGEKENIQDPKAIAVNLVAVFGISIPVIIRSGENNASITVSDVNFNQQTDSGPSVSFSCSRSGDMSVYGDIAIDYLSPEGKTVHIGSAKGLAIYNPTAKRNFNIALQPPSGTDFHKGSIRVTYNYETGKADKSAEGSVSLK